MYESIHSAFAFCERDLSVLVPEGFVSHHGVSLFHLSCLSLEELFWQFVECEVAHSCVSYDDTFLYPAGEFYLSDHIVDGEYPR